MDPDGPAAQDQHHAHTETPADLVPAAQNGPALPPQMKVI
jgi:hypothetical protein